MVQVSETVIALDLLIVVAKTARANIVPALAALKMPASASVDPLAWVELTNHLTTRVFEVLTRWVTAPR
jgi:hypothetical protein